MKFKSFLLPLSVLALLICSAVSTRSQTVITFDDMTSSVFSNGMTFLQTETAITNGYQGLNWANFLTENAPLIVNTFGTDGYYYGMVTASNVAFNGGGTTSEVDAISTNFNFLSAYLTGAWNSNLNIEVQGFRSGTMLYDTTVVASATSPTLFTFNYLDIDSLTFNSFGGQDADFPPPRSGGEQFAMDNFTFEFVPEPSSLLLAAAGSLLLCPLLKRKRALR
jgi:hypothetical protein